MAIFQPKMAQKWHFMAKIPNPFILIQYDYALQAGVNILRNSERILGEKFVYFGIWGRVR